MIISVPGSRLTCSAAGVAQTQKRMCEDKMIIAVLMTTDFRRWKVEGLVTFLRRSLRAVTIVLEESDSLGGGRM